jgi:uncharacterized protein (DUF1778 family)
MTRDGKVPLSLRVYPETLSLIRRSAKAHKATMSAYVTAAVEEKAARDIGEALGLGARPMPKKQR